MEFISSPSSFSFLRHAQYLHNAWLILLTYNRYLSSTLRIINITTLLIFYFQFFLFCHLPNKTSSHISTYIIIVVRRRLLYCVNQSFLLTKISEKVNGRRERERKRKKAARANPFCVDICISRTTKLGFFLASHYILSFSLVIKTTAHKAQSQQIYLMIYFLLEYTSERDRKLRRFVFFPHLLFCLFIWFLLELSLWLKFHERLGELVMMLFFFFVLVNRS